MRRPLGVMPMQTYVKILTEHKAKTVCLSMFGEALVDPLLDNRIALTRNIIPGVEIYFHTNGIGLNKARAKRLKDAGLSRLVVSAYGTKEQHERLQPPAKHDHVRQAVADTVALGIPVMVNSSRVEPMSLDSLRLYWKEVGATFHSNTALDWGDGEVCSGSLASCNACEIMQNYRLFEWDGSMICCSMDFNLKTTFGNANSDTWETAIARLRTLPDFKFCETCPFVSKFNAWRKV